MSSYSNRPYALTLLDEDGYGVTCPLDGSESTYLGTLGYLDQYRCRACGIVFSAPAMSKF